MFTLKFWSIFGGEGNLSATRFISCDCFEIYEFNNRYEIDIASQVDGKSAITYKIMSANSAADKGDSGFYQGCYIENEKGKTIHSLHFSSLTDESKIPELETVDQE